MVTTPGNAPDKEGKRFDPNCDANNPQLDAKSGAPPAGTWFHAQVWYIYILNFAVPTCVCGPFLGKLLLWPTVGNIPLLQDSSRTYIHMIVFLNHFVSLTICIRMEKQK